MHVWIHEYNTSTHRLRCTCLLARVNDRVAKSSHLIDFDMAVKTQTKKGHKKEIEQK